MDLLFGGYDPKMVCSDISNVKSSDESTHLQSHVIGADPLLSMATKLVRSYAYKLPRTDLIQQTSVSAVYKGSQIETTRSYALSEWLLARYRKSGKLHSPRKRFG